MANEQKDRFGDKLRDAEKGREDEYFARRDRELLEKMRRRPPEGADDQDKKEGGR